MTLEHVRINLEQLGCRLCAEEMWALYTIDLNKIIETCQIDEVEALVLRRYGKEAYRIYRFLAKEGVYTETDQVADKTFVEKKESLGILYKLWKDDYLDMESLQRTVQMAGVLTDLFLMESEKGSLGTYPQ